MKKCIVTVLAIVAISTLSGCGPEQNKPCGTADHNKTVQGPTKYETYTCRVSPGGEWQWQR